MDISAIEAEWKRNQARQRDYAKRAGFQVPRGQILSPPWRPRW
jgi:hypothetical protein